MKTADSARRRRDPDSFATVDFLDALKARHELTSDYQLAKLLRWPTQRISMYRTTDRELDDAACVQVAHSLGADPEYVLASIAAARAKNDEVKQYWAAAARRLKTKFGAGLLAAVVLAGSSVQPAPSSAAPTASVNRTSYTLCARRGTRDRRRRWRPPRRKARTVTATAAEPCQAR